MLANKIEKAVLTNIIEECTLNNCFSKINITLSKVNSISLILALQIIKEKQTFYEEYISNILMEEDFKKLDINNYLLKIEVKNNVLYASIKGSQLKDYQLIFKIFEDTIAADCFPFKPSCILQLVDANNLFFYNKKLSSELDKAAIEIMRQLDSYILDYLYIESKLIKSSVIKPSKETINKILDGIFSDTDEDLQTYIIRTIKEIIVDEMWYILEESCHSFLENNISIFKEDSKLIEPVLKDIKSFMQNRLRDKTINYSYVTIQDLLLLNSIL